MSFQKLSKFLDTAAERIGEKDSLKKAYRESELEKKITKLFPKRNFEYSFEYRNGIIVLYSNSALLKQKIFFSKKTLLENIRHLGVSDIVFKGSRQ